MARIRTVKPDLFRHGGLYDLEKETGLPIRLCFIALFTCCDREGRFKWRPRELKLDCIPYDDIDFSRVLDALTTRGFVVKYAKNKQVYGCIPTFSDHQVINNREKDSSIPDYSECICQVIDNYEELTREPRVIDASTTPLEQDQGEGKGKEGNKEGKGNNIGDKSPDRFDEFWDVFADKRGKTDAQKIWDRKKLNTIADKVIFGAMQYKKARGPDRRYWKQASGWLNGGRWEDEPLDMNGQQKQVKQSFEDIDYGQSGDLRDL